MKNIPVWNTFAIVDDEDYDLVSDLKWSLAGKGYAVKQIKRKNVYMHRFIMNCPPGSTVDHINRNPLDNRKENLRICSYSDNLKNKKRQSNNKSGFKGVDFRYGRWRSTIHVEKKQLMVGWFDSIEEAAKAYDNAARKYHGEFSYLNFP